MRIILLALICLSLNCYSQKNDSVTVSNVKEEVKPVEVDTPSKEVELYKLLYEAEKTNNESLVNLTYWSFGISMAFIILIVGSQIYFNYRLGKKDILKIKAELSERMTLAKTEIEKGLNATVTEFKTEVSNKMDDMTSEISVNRILQDQKVLSVEHSVIQAKLSSDLGQMGVVTKLEYYKRLIEIELKLDTPFMISVDDLTEVLKKEKEIPNFNFLNLSSLLKKFPASLEDERKKLSDILAMVGVYEYQNDSDPQKNTRRYVVIQKGIL